MALKIYWLRYSDDSSIVYGVPDPKTILQKIDDIASLQEGQLLGDVQLLIPNKQHTDFYNLDNSVLLFNKRVATGPLMAPLHHCGNICKVRLTDSNSPLFLFYPTTTINCLNFERTTYLGPGLKPIIGDVGNQLIVKPFFYSKIVGGDYVFSTPQMRGAIFTSSSGTDSDDDFFSIYHDEGYTGLDFELMESE